MDIDTSELQKITQAITDVANGRRERVTWRGEHRQLSSLVRAINRALRTRPASPPIVSRPAVWSDPLSMHRVENGEFCQSCAASMSAAQFHKRRSK